MTSHTVLHFSPPKAKKISAGGSPSRIKTPSPEKRCLPYTTFIFPPQTVTEASRGSPTKKLKTSDGSSIDPVIQFEVKLDQTSANLTRGIAQSKRLKLAYSLVENGRPTTPPLGDWSDLTNLFPTTVSVEIMPPFLVFTVREVPPRPWPLTVAGLPIMFHSEFEFQSALLPGQPGRGPPSLDNLRLRTSTDYSRQVLEQAVQVFDDLKQDLFEIYWFGSFWRITVPDGADFQRLPRRLGDAQCFYRVESELPAIDQAALRRKPPQGIEYDDTNYGVDENALLRPGIMLSSSYFPVTENGQARSRYNTTSSGILVADQYGQIFITVAAHGFQEDGNVYHPNPDTGRIIGQVVKNLRGTDIAIVKLEPGLRYTNETFGSDDNPAGFYINGIAPPYAPHLRAFDEVKMNNPFTGSSEGTIMALGAKIIGEEGNRKFIRHDWHMFENGDQPVDRSCGAPILDDQDRVVGLFRFREPTSNLCLSISATELREFGYEICGGEQTF
ncbi:MAG: hypothetical protein LQ338_006994 [Usnochroma carphineum]|nr:MAG: hypothetical protein LQ338_006994 [Usnochroma carphineum]